MFQRISRRRPRYADVAATLALILAMGGTAYAATVLPAKSVGAKQLKTGAVTTSKLRALAVTSAKIGAGAVGADQIQPGSITGTQIAAGSIGGSRITPNSLDLADLVGTDVSGGISFTIAAHTCSDVTLGVSGAAVGQVALMSWQGHVAPPSTIAIGPLRVPAANKVSGAFCNVGTATVSESGIGVRVVTFG